MSYLSPRLQLVYENLLPDEDVWDFCCDHGYLGGAAYKSQLFKNIYFVDPVPSIMDNLINRFQTYAFNKENKSTAHFLTQEGQSVRQTVHGTACIIGVGGLLIHEILDGLAKNQFLNAERLILGPHKDEEKLLTMLESNPLFKKYKLHSKKEIPEGYRKRIFFIFDKQK